MKRIHKIAWVLWDNIKHTSICVIEILEGEEREIKDLRKYLKR